MEKTKSHRLIPNNSDMLLSWDEIFHMLAFHYQHDLLRRSTSKKLTQKEQDQYLVSVAGTYILSDLQVHNEDRILPLIRHVTNHANIDLKLKDVGLYFSLLPGTETHGIHRDVTDVYHWQQQGVTQWTVYDITGKYTYNLTPGDMIYVPAGMYHNTTPITARAGLTFGHFPDDWNNDSPEEYIQQKNDSSISTSISFPYAS